MCSINTKILFLTIVILVSQGQQVKENFQKRQLYYNSEDQVCHGGLPARKDIIVLGLHFENKSQNGTSTFYKGYFADGGTLCDNMVKQPWNTVMAVKNWDYFYRNSDYKNVTRIKFRQTIQTKYTVFLRRTKSIVVSATIVNPTIIEDKPFICEIVGNGEIMHYGYYERRNPCAFSINCERQDKTVKQE